MAQLIGSHLDVAPELRRVELVNATEGLPRRAPALSIDTARVTVPEIAEWIKERGEASVRR